jgi:hypothetical protein
MAGGINETKELLVAVDELALFLISVLKDGFKASEDIPAIIAKLSKDEEFVAVMKKAVEGIANVPAEIKDLQIEEVVELVQLELAYVPKFLNAIKK